MKTALLYLALAFCLYALFVDMDRANDLVRGVADYLAHLI